MTATTNDIMLDLIMRADTAQLLTTLVRRQNVNATVSTATLPSVVYFDDLIEQFKDDDTGLPPLEDEDDGDNKPRCVYAYNGIESDEDFADLRDPKAAERENCQETPEYYIKAYSSDPGDAEPTLETYYYCPRHFALNLGYLCDTMARRTPVMEMKRYMLRGELPPRYTLQEWGPLAALQ